MGIGQYKYLKTTAFPFFLLVIVIPLKIILQMYLQNNVWHNFLREVRNRWYVNVNPFFPAHRRKCDTKPTISGEVWNNMILTLLLSVIYPFDSHPIDTKGRRSSYWYVHSLLKWVRSCGPIPGLSHLQMMIVSTLTSRSCRRVSRCIPTLAPYKHDHGVNK